MPDVRTHGRHSSLESLAEIDKRILRLVAQGRSSKEIGKSLHRSPLTIDGRLKDVCVRLGAENRVQAASMLLVREVNAVPPSFGAPPNEGIDTGVGEARREWEDEGRRPESAAASPPSADRKHRHMADRVRSLIHGENVGTKSPGERLARILWSVLLITAGLALTAYLLATALEAFQEVVFGIRS